MLAVGAPSSRVEVIEKRTNEGSHTTVDTTEGDRIEGVDSGKPDPPACYSSALCASGLIHLQPFLYFMMNWVLLHVFLLGWGKWKVISRVKS